MQMKRESTLHQNKKRMKSEKFKSSLSEFEMTYNLFECILCSDDRWTKRENWGSRKAALLSIQSLLSSLLLIFQICHHPAFENK